ncbi:MAG: NFYB/HAP3 family transcription factor subunit [Candidatus Marsarchaeota archaeon]|jgi:histone H3/H4|nr:NFYB/HAP3 family transcription factor subunit [Candidatus Marsarchaeota archaeon]
MYIKRSSIKRMFKDAGASRVSEEAVNAFQGKVERIAFDAATKSVNLSKHAKRKTVYISDVKLAFQ